MTVRELLDDLKQADLDKEVWISIPTRKSIHIIKDATSTHIDAIEGAIVIECSKLNRVQEEYIV